MIPMPAMEGQQARKVNLALLIGEEELRVEAVDETSGGKRCVSIREES